MSQRTARFLLMLVAALALVTGARSSAAAGPSRLQPQSASLPFMIEGRIVRAAPGMITVVAATAPICQPSPGHVCPMVITAPRIWQVDDRLAQVFTVEGRSSLKALAPSEAVVVYGDIQAPSPPGPSTLLFWRPVAAGTIHAAGIFLLAPLPQGAAPDREPVA